MSGPLVADDGVWRIGSLLLVEAEDRAAVALRRGRPFVRDEIPRVALKRKA